MYSLNKFFVTVKEWMCNSYMHVAVVFDGKGFKNACKLTIQVNCKYTTIMTIIIILNERINIFITTRNDHI